MNLNRRKYHRIRTINSPCVLTYKDESYEVVLIDESIEGIRVGNIKLEQMYRNEEIQLEIDGRVIRGRTRSVSRAGDDIYEIGFQRENTIRGDQPENQLLGHFIRFEGRWIACFIIGSSSQYQARIELFGGKQFPIRRNQIFQLTREERQAMLEDVKEFNSTIELYETMDPSLNLESIQSVLDHEFTKPVPVPFGPMLAPVDSSLN